jgi:hypothetical protein
VQFGQLDISALYPDFAWQTLDAIVDRGTAVEELQALRWVAIERATDDIGAYMRKSGFINAYTSGVSVQSGTPDCSCAVPELPHALSTFRGVKAALKERCALSQTLKRIHVPRLEVWSKVAYQNLEIIVKDNGYQYTITVPQITAGKNDIYALLNMLPIVSEGKSIEFHVDITQYPELCVINQFCPCSMKGGKLPFTLETFDGYSFKKGTRLKAAGIVAEFATVCDYKNLLCLFANNGNKSAAWLVLYKMGELIAEKTLQTSRLNPFVVFGREDAEDKRAKYNALYSEKYSDIINAAKNALQNIDTDCITCKGVRVLSNI